MNKQGEIIYFQNLMSYLKVLKMINFRLGKIYLPLLMLFQKQKKSIHLPTYQKLKNYACNVQSEIKKSASLLRLNEILATKLRIFYVFVKICTKKKKIIKKNMIYVLIKSNKRSFAKLLRLIMNNLNVNLQYCLTSLLFDLKLIHYSVYNKNFFIKKTFIK